VSIVFATRYSDQSGAKQGGESEKDACEVSPGAVDVTLSCDEEGKVSQSAKREAAMSAWEASPAVMQHMMILFRAHFKCHKLVRRCSWRRLASRDEVRPWPPYRILNDVGYEQRKYHAYEPAEDRDVRFMGAGTDEDSPEDDDAEGYRTSVDEEPC
jgi:hypothetical protein